MRVISRRPLRDFWEIHPQAKVPFCAWFRVMEQTRFANFNAIKVAFPAVDYVAPFTIFDVGRNKFRLITAIHHNTGRVYVRHVFTHPEYDKWSNDRPRRKRLKRDK
jgi:mRNA interferase HigB